MLNNAQKKQLKGIASTLKVKYQLGKNGITDTAVDMFENALVAHELIKIDVMKGAADNKMELALDLSSKLNAEIVQVIGNSIILYKRNKDNPKIQLVK